MSFEVLVVSFKAGETGATDGVSREQVRRAFEPFVSDDRDGWKLQYGDKRDCAVLLHPHAMDDTRLEGFTVVRPIQDERLWDALASILKLGNLVLFAPQADCPPLIADPKVAQELTPEMIGDMGKPKCVKSGRDILDALDASS